jgi:itaconate CoA-transferase
MNSYLQEYKAKLSTPDRAVEKILSGDTIVNGSCVAEPPALLGAIASRAREGNLSGLKVYSSLPMDYSARTIFAPDLSDCIQPYSWFATGSDRSRIKVGLNYYVPNYAHQLPRFCSDFLHIDDVITTVSPMDNAGYFTFGAVNDYIAVAARHSKRVIVEVNENMPRVFGDSLLHISEVSALVENNVPLLEIPTPKIRPEDEVIGKYIAEMVPDGATIELGIGGIPNAIARCLENHRDLGVHSGVFVSAMVDLIEKGVINGRKKTIHPRKNLFTIAQGNKRMYDFINNNPSMESYPVSYIENSNVIARNDNMIAINSILEIDLMGQCNSESLGGYQFSGSGGQLDFMRGAFESQGGKAILAFYATSNQGKSSKIIPRLETGTIVTTPRMDIQYLVTEYGVANLMGKSTRERALDIISLAHPQFREELLRAAEDMYII